MLKKAIQASVTFSVIFKKICQEFIFDKVMIFPMAVKEIDLEID